MKPKESTITVSTIHNFINTWTLKIAKRQKTSHLTFLSVSSLHHFHPLQNSCGHISITTPSFNELFLLSSIFLPQKGITRTLVVGLGHIVSLSWLLPISNSILNACKKIKGKSCLMYWSFTLKSSKTLSLPSRWETMPVVTFPWKNPWPCPTSLNTSSPILYESSTLSLKNSPRLLVHNTISSNSNSAGSEHKYLLIFNQSITKCYLISLKSQWKLKVWIKILRNWSIKVKQEEKVGLEDLLKAKIKPDDISKIKIDIGLKAFCNHEI